LEGDTRVQRFTLLNDLFRQLASDSPRIDAGQWCAHNAFVGTILLGGALLLRFSGPPYLLVRPALVPALLATDGIAVLALTIAFSIACIGWARHSAGIRSFRYLPGLITTGATYGAALWSDFGPSRANPRRWRQAGFVIGIALGLVVGAVVIPAALRA
jgi:hypothetical protein